MVFGQALEEMGERSVIPILIECLSKPNPGMSTFQTGEKRVTWAERDVALALLVIWGLLLCFLGYPLLRIQLVMTGIVGGVMCHTNDDCQSPKTCKTVGYSTFTFHLCQ